MSYLKYVIPFRHSTLRSELRSCTHVDIFILDAAFTAMPRTEREIERLRWNERNKKCIWRGKPH